MAQKTARANDYIWTDKSEPHHERRKAILEKYPEVRKLIGPDIRLAFITVALVIIQLTIAYFIDRVNIWVMLITAYFIGATITHSLFLAIHEITHNLAFKKQTANNWLALFANIPIVFPYAISFKVYHTIHHRNQGKDGLDVDIPSKFETTIFRGFIGKMVWAFFQIIFYAFRPIFTYPVKPNKWTIINFIFQVIAMVVFIYFAGWTAVLYLIISDFLAGSLHPLSGHYISEHYVFKDGQETYSYYGPLNKLIFNAGYHNEHHDFPSIPGSRLPKLKKLAPEYYDNIYSYKSWVWVIYKFITDPSITLYSRVKRT